MTPIPAHDAPGVTTRFPEFRKPPFWTTAPRILLWAVTSGGHEGWEILEIVVLKKKHFQGLTMSLYSIVLRRAACFQNRHFRSTVPEERIIWKDIRWLQK